MAPESGHKRRKVGDTKWVNGAGATPYNMSTSASNTGGTTPAIDAMLEKYGADSDVLTTRYGQFLDGLKKAIASIPERSPLSVAEAQAALKKDGRVEVPFPDPQPAGDACDLQYQRPIRIETVGSFYSQTFSKKDNIIDLAVQIPDTVFDPKDHMSFEYFYKRAFYVACIAAGLQKLKDHQGQPFKVHYRYEHGNSLQPAVIIEGPGKLLVCVMPAISEKGFPLSSIAKKSAERDRKSASGDNHKPSTPFIKATILSEACIFPHRDILATASAKCDAFRGACILGKIWLRQRGLNSTVLGGGFGCFEWTIITALLLTGDSRDTSRFFSPGYSALQLFKALLQFISKRDLTSTSKGGGPDLVPSTATRASPVFLDPARGFNVLFKMNQWSYNLLRYEATISLEALSVATNDPTRTVFSDSSSSSSMLQKFDRYVKVPIPRESSELKFRQKLYSVLVIGLGDRARLVHLFDPKSAHNWAVNSQAPPTLEHSEYVLVGILVNPENINRTVDHGPSAEDKAASQDFQKFWGNKSELRRFQDGRIVESLIWSSAANEDPPLQQIISYILHRHLGQIKSKAISFYGEQFDRLLVENKPSSGLTGFNPIMESFRNLQEKIRQADLPLQISQIDGTSSQLTYSSLEVPLYLGDKMKQPAQVLLQFERSARWPDALSAIQITKIAFLNQIAEALAESFEEEVSLRIGIENEDSTVLNQVFLEATFENGATFNLRIHHDREATLLTRMISGDESSSQIDRAKTALLTYARDFIHAPRHAQAVRRLCTQHTVLSPTIRLFKQWCNSHLLSNHFTEQLLELLVIRVFVHSAPYDPPSSVMTGFTRTLQMLADWDWLNSPLIVDMAQDMSPETVAHVCKHFELRKKVDPNTEGFALFVATDLDLNEWTWSREGPGKLIASRMTDLASAAVSLMNDAGVNLNPSTLFSHSEEDYDFIIRIHAKFAKNQASSKAAFKNLQDTAKYQNEVIGYTPLQWYYAELLRLYGDQMVLFMNDDGEKPAIRGLWNPQYAHERAWKPSLPYSSKLPKRKEGTGSEEDGGEGVVETSINKAAILREVAAIGGTLVKQVVVQR